MPQILLNATNLTIFLHPKSEKEIKPPPLTLKYVEKICFLKPTSLKIPYIFYIIILICCSFYQTNSQNINTIYGLESLGSSFLNNVSANKVPLHPPLLNIGKFLQGNKVQFNDNVKTDEVITQTLSGKVRGLRTYPTTTTKDFDCLDVYYGIPFAKPPIGELRFRAPKAIEPWEGILDALHPPNSCVQTLDTVFGDFRGSNMWNANTPISEDCLYLNLWVPNKSKSKLLSDKVRNVSTIPITNYLPIIVWIYGGGYYSGTITLDVYNAKILASHMNVIVMSMNYRFGSLGFLYSGTQEAPGNQGLLDQLLAIKWMQSNAKVFGGDPKRITLMGESAGASSVAFQLLSPVSSEYFNNAILQSASATSPWALVTPQEALHRTTLLADSLKCPYTNISGVYANEIMKCLRSVNHTTLLDREFVTTNVMQFPFVPVIDGHFIIANPRKLLALGLFKRAPLLVGSNLNEGTSFSIYYLDKMFQPLRNDVSNLRPNDISIATKDIYWHLDPVSQQSVAFHYSPWDQPENPEKILRSIDYMAGDLWFTCNVNEFASHYAVMGMDVYMYQFAHRSSQNPWPVWMGVMHGDEIPFVFGEPFRNDTMLNYTPEEKQLSMLMMRYWSNFAYTSNPNRFPTGRTIDIPWPLYNAYQKYYLKLTTHMTPRTLNVERGPRMRSCAFQKIYLPQLQNDIDEITQNCPTGGSKPTHASYNYKKHIILSLLVNVYVIHCLYLNYF